jgi:hypothetical protein
MAKMVTFNSCLEDKTYLLLGETPNTWGWCIKMQKRIDDIYSIHPDCPLEDAPEKPLINIASAFEGKEFSSHLKECFGKVKGR